MTLVQPAAPALFLCVPSSGESSRWIIDLLEGRLSPDNNSYCLWNGGDRPDKWKWNNMENSSRLTGVHCDFYFDGLVQDCSNSSALAMELLQSCTKPSICFCFCIWVLTKTYSWLCDKGTYSDDDKNSIMQPNAGIILCMRPANERRRCNVPSPLICWAHTQNDASISGIVQTGVTWVYLD